MSNASFANLGASVRERDRRLAQQLDSPGTPGAAQAGYLMPQWDALYGSLREQAGPGGYRLTGGGTSLGGDPGGTTQRPGDEDAARTIAINAYLGDLTDRQRLTAQNLQQEQAHTELAKNAAATSTADLAARNQMDRMLVPPEAPSTVTRTPGMVGPQLPGQEYRGDPTVTVQSKPQTDRERILASVPGHLKPQIMMQLAEQDAKNAALNPFGQMGGQRAVGALGAPADVTGDDFLKTIPPPLQKQVQAYAEGRLPFPTGMALKTPYFQQMLQAVGQYDPSFDAINYNARNKAYSDLTSPSGTGGKSVNALNTAAQHISKLSDLVEKLDNFDTPGPYNIFNAGRNAIERAGGSTKVTNFDAVQPQAMKEIERLWRGAGGSSGEIDKLKESLGPNMGKQQQREALAEFADLMLGKLDATRQQRDNALGPIASKRVPIIFDQNKAALGKIFERAGKSVPEVLGGAPAPAAAADATQSANPTAAPKEGAQRGIPGVEGGLAEFRNGKWIRVQ